MVAMSAAVNWFAAAGADSAVFQETMTGRSYRTGGPMAGHNGIARLVRRNPVNSACDRGDDTGGDGFAATNGIHAFVRFGLQVDLLGRDAERLG